MIGPFQENTIAVGDCANHLHELPDESVTAVLCDPPYGLSKQPDIREVLAAWLNDEEYRGATGGFMGKEWDSFVPGPAVWKEIYRVMKPGAVLLAFGGTRTADLLGLALRLAGFEIADTVMWLTGQGFPKSHDISKAIDKAAGAEREVVGHREWNDSMSKPYTNAHYGGERCRDDAPMPITAPATPEAAEWDGYGTALKPAWEPIILARKPRGKTYRECAVEHGSAALNIDGSRIAIDMAEGMNSKDFRTTPCQSSHIGLPLTEYDPNEERIAVNDPHPLSCRHNANGRWPANVILSHLPECRQVGVKRVKGDKRDGSITPTPARSWKNQSVAGIARQGHADPDGYEEIEAWECAEGCPVRMLDEQSGDMRPSYRNGNRQCRNGIIRVPLAGNYDRVGLGYYDTGGASRFFYCAKASRGERDVGLEDVIDQDPTGNWTGGNVRTCRNCSRTHPATHYGSCLRCGSEDIEWRPETGIGRTRERPRNPHPTIKPLALTEYLARLIRPPEECLDDAIILIPFCGTGSEIIGAIKAGWQNWLGIEIDEQYAEIARARIAYWQAEVEKERAQLELGL